MQARDRTEFPWGTCVVNLSGSFVLGLITGLALVPRLPEDARLVLGTGFCGAYTTFSTFTFETLRLAEGGRIGLAASQRGGEHGRRAASSLDCRVGARRAVSKAGAMSELTMSKATREAFLAGVHVGVFCVSRPGAAPLATPVWYLYEPGGDVRVIIGAESEKAELVQGRRGGVAVRAERIDAVRVRDGRGAGGARGRRRGLAFEIAERYLGPDLAKGYVEQTAGVDRRRGADHAAALADEGLLGLERPRAMEARRSASSGSERWAPRVGGALVAGGARVVSVLSDRSAASRDPGDRRGHQDVADLGGLVAASDVVLSIVPPGVASVGRGRGRRRGEGVGRSNAVFVDCNAISPGRRREIAGVVATGGMTYVDGGIIGAPPARVDRPRSTCRAQAAT